MSGKSFFTNFVCFCVVIVGLVLPASSFREFVLSVGLFGLSGGLTNWAAIQMIFEKVPFVYGSGVILLRFESFKSAIRTMLMDNFFNRENFDKLRRGDAVVLFDPCKVADLIDMDGVFDEIKSMVMESGIGPLLGMVGGESAIESFRSDFKTRFGRKLPELLETARFGDWLEKEAGFEKLAASVETLIDARLAELTPRHVKRIVEQMIREHLGWLVVWGGVFGGAMGALAHFVG